MAHACCRSRGESDVGTITKSAGVMAPSSRRPCGGVRPRRSARPQGAWRRVAACSGSQVSRLRCRGFRRCPRRCPSTGWRWAAGPRPKTRPWSRDAGTSSGDEEQDAGGLGDPALVVRDGDNHDETPSGDSVVRCFKCFGTSACPLFSMSAFRFSVFSSMDVQRHGSAHPKERLLFRCRHHRR